MKAGERTKQRILAAGVELWAEGLAMPSLRRVAGRAGLSHASVLYHFPELQPALARHAVSTRNARVTALLVMAGDPAIDGLTLSERQEALRSGSSPTPSMTGG